MYENFVTLTGEQQQQQKFTQLLIDDITTWRSWNHMISHANGVPCKNNGRMIHWDARYDITWYHMHVNIADATTTGAWFIESNRSINLSLIFYPCIQHMWLQTSLSVSKTDCSKFFFPSFSTFNSNLVVNHAVYVNTLLTTDLHVRQTPSWGPMSFSWVLHLLTHWQNNVQLYEFFHQSQTNQCQRL